MTLVAAPQIAEAQTNAAGVEPKAVAKDAEKPEPEKPVVKNSLARWR